MGEIWGMIKRMGGERKEWGYPALVDGNNMVVENSEKPEVMGKKFVRVHSSDNNK